MIHIFPSNETYQAKCLHSHSCDGLKLGVLKVSGFTRFHVLPLLEFQTPLSVSFSIRSGFHPPNSHILLSYTIHPAPSLGIHGALSVINSQLYLFCSHVMESALTSKNQNIKMYKIKNL